MKRQMSTVAAMLAIASLALQAGCGKKESNIGEKPERKAGPPVEVKEESLVTVNVLFPYTALSNGITAAIPAAIPVEGRKNVCKKVLIEICTDIDYKATVTREGDVSVAPQADSVRLTAPLKVDGYAGFNGFVADLLKLDRKNFRGALRVNADARLDIDEAWCPKVAVTPSYEWTNKAEFEIAGRWWLPIDSQVDAALKPELDKAAAKIPEYATCDMVKQLVQPAWRQHIVPLPAIAGQVGSLVVTPHRAGFSGLAYRPEGVQLALMIGAQTEVKLATAGGGTPASAAPSAPAAATPLPKLERIPADQNKLKLAVPLTAEYASLQALAASAVVGKTFEGTAGDTQASVTIKKIEVYPSGERLVVGAEFESKISKPKSLAPQGWIYFVAKPIFDPATQTLSLTDVDFSRVIDNDLWNMLSFLFQGQIRKEIERAARFDLRPRIAEAKDVLRKELATPKQGIKLDLKDEAFGLNRVAITEAGVQVVVTFEGAANITVLDIPK